MTLRAIQLAEAIKMTNTISHSAGAWTMVQIASMIIIIAAIIVQAIAAVLTQF